MLRLGLGNSLARRWGDVSRCLRGIEDGTREEVSAEGCVGLLVCLNVDVFESLMEPADLDLGSVEFASESLRGDLGTGVADTSYMDWWLFAVFCFGCLRDLRVGENVAGSVFMANPGSSFGFLMANPGFGFLMVNPGSGFGFFKRELGRGAVLALSSTVLCDPGVGRDISSDCVESRC